jgi:predicted secreted hydrolase
VRLFIAKLFEKIFIHTNKALKEITFTEQDNFPHREFPVEWWYFSGFLNAGKSENPVADFAFEISFFRAKNPLERSMLHIALSDLQNKTFYYGETISSGNVSFNNIDNIEKNNGAAVVLKVKDNVLLFDKERSMFLCKSNLMCSRAMDVDKLPGKRFAAQALSNKHGSAEKLNSSNKIPILFDFSLKVNSVMLEGKNGIIEMAHGKGGSSYYITYPDMDVAGKLAIGSKELAVSGTAWHDHQFGIFTVFDSAWNWFSLRFERERIYIMVFEFVKHSKKGTCVAMANVFKNGKSILFDDVKIEKKESFNLSSGTVYPLVWEIHIFEKGTEVFRFSVTPFLKECEFRSHFAPNYWEGPCKVLGEIVTDFSKENVHFEKKSLKGRAFVELVGYSR